jgi:hypothetical protein
MTWKSVESLPVIARLANPGNQDMETGVQRDPLRKTFSGAAGESDLPAVALSDNRPRQ